MNGYPSFYPRIALVAPSPGVINQRNINSKVLNVAFGIHVLANSALWRPSWKMAATATTVQIQNASGL